MATVHQKKKAAATGIVSNKAREMGWLMLGLLVNRFTAFKLA